MGTMEGLTEQELLDWRELVAQCQSVWRHTDWGNRRQINIGSEKRRQLIIKVDKLLRLKGKEV